MGQRALLQVKGAEQVRNPVDTRARQRKRKIVLVRIIRKHLDNLLPEPLADVRAREQAQQAKTRAALARIARKARRS